MIALSPLHARRLLLDAVGLGPSSSWPSAPDDACRALLSRLGCIQLDPIDRIGTNAERVAAARIPGLQRGQLHGLLAGHTFEHFAKERCLLPVRFFPWYRAQAVETPWWRHTARMRQVDDALLADVLAEIQERGPLSSSQLTDRGEADGVGWEGWSYVRRRAALAVEVLWTRCALVVSSRTPGGHRRYDLPERALPPAAFEAVEGVFGEEMVVERARSAGLLSRAAGPWWSMLSAARTDGTVERLLAAGRLVEVEIARRPYLTLPERLAAVSALPERPPGALLALAPLDPLLWDRRLVQAVWGFDYVWEVYKPASARRWGYYVCPLLWGEGLVGRIEAQRQPGGVLEVVGVFWEPGVSATEMAAPLRGLVAALAAFNGCSEVRGVG